MTFFSSGSPASIVYAHPSDFGRQKESVVGPFETPDIAAYGDVKASMAAKNLAPPVRAASARVVIAAGQFDDVATIGE